MIILPIVFLGFMCFSVYRLYRELYKSKKDRNSKMLIKFQKNQINKNMIYDPKTGWRSTPELIQENSERMLAAQEADNIELIQKMIANADGYFQYLKSIENPNERRQALESYGEYLARHVGYGAIGDFSKH